MNGACLNYEFENERNKRMSTVHQGIKTGFLLLAVIKDAVLEKSVNKKFSLLPEIYGKRRGKVCKNRRKRKLRDLIPESEIKLLELSKNILITTIT
jgi:hypothetical protein